MSKSLFLVLACSASLVTGCLGAGGSSKSPTLPEASHLSSTSSLRSALEAKGTTCSSSDADSGSSGRTFNCSTADGKLAAYVFPDSSSLSSWRSGLTADPVVCQSGGILAQTQSLAGENWIVIDDTPGQASQAATQLARKFNRVATSFC